VLLQRWVALRSASLHIPGDQSQHVMVRYFLQHGGLLDAPDSPRRHHIILTDRNVVIPLLTGY